MTARARQKASDDADDKATDKADDAATSDDKPSGAKSDSKSDDDGDDSGKSSGTSYLNTTGGPLIYDGEGHSVGAGEWTPEINLDAIGKGLRQNDYLQPRSAL